MQSQNYEGGGGGGGGGGQWRIQRGVWVLQHPPAQLNNSSQHRKQITTYYVSCTYPAKQQSDIKGVGLVISINKSFCACVN